jgi:hypothetical protein
MIGEAGSPSSAFSSLLQLQHLSRDGTSRLRETTLSVTIAAIVWDLSKFRDPFPLMTIYIFL